MKKVLILFILFLLLLLPFDFSEIGTIKIDIARAATGDITTSLQGRWTFDTADISGGTANDVSGNSRHGTITGATGDTGNINQALVFGGSSTTNVSIADSSALRLNGGGTISAWVYLTGEGGGNFGRIIDKSTDTNATSGYSLFYSFAQKNFLVRAGGTLIDATSATFTGSTWTHVAVTIASNGSTEIFVNGVSKQTASLTVPPNTAGSITIGNITTSLNRVTTGRIDDVRIYNRVLSTDDITALYNFTGSQSISPSPNTINQNSTGNSITVTGTGTAWTAGTPGTPTFTLSGGTGASITAQTVTDSTHATLTVNAGSATGNLTITDPSTGSTTTVTVGADNTAPTISSVTSSASSGTYETGDVIPLTVNFSEAVTSTGNVTITLNTTPTRTCTFTVSNATSGSCNYTVQSGDSASTLNTTISGTIADQTDNAMSNFTPAANLADSKTIVIHTALSVNAGDDQNITLPTNSVTLNGSASDSGATISTYAWTETSGLGSTIESPSSASTDVSDLQEGTYTFQLSVTDSVGANVTDSVTVTVNGESAPSCTSKEVAILGSSTAAGNGASSYANSWAGLFTSYLDDLDDSHSVTNLAVAGYTSYEVLPTGTSNPGGRPAVNTTHNITTAINGGAHGIIVNLPSNDTVNGYANSETQTNFELLRTTADAASIPIWFTTTQPRDTSSGNRANLTTLKNWINSTYDDHAIDFWTGLDDGSGGLVDAYDSGDGVHLNNAGHQLVYTRVISSNVVTTICDATDPVTTASGGSYTLGTWTNSNVNVSLSCNDSSGAGCRTTKYCTDSSNTCNPASGTTYSSAVAFSSEGTTYIRYLSTDENFNSETAKSSTIKIDATDPTVDSGSDQTKNASFTQTATASDADSDIDNTTYQWAKVSGPGTITFGSANSLGTTISASADGDYVISFTADDNAGNSDSDNFSLTWDASGPTVDAGSNQSQSASFTQTASASDDGVGIDAGSYQWAKVSGPGTITFGSANSLATTISASTDGTYVISFTADDTLGNSNSDTFTLTWGSVSTPAQNNQNNTPRGNILILPPNVIPTIPSFTPAPPVPNQPTTLQPQTTFNNGAVIIANPNVTLNIKPAPYAKKMQISNSPDFTGVPIQNFSEQIDWNICSQPIQFTSQLPCTNGIRKVYIKLMTESEIFSTVTVATIIFKQDSYTSRPTNNLPAASAVPKYNFTQILDYGSTNIEVRSLQEILQHLGYFPSDVDPNGVFGPITREAVRKFQCAYDIACSTDTPGYGRVGPTTRAQLNELNK